MLLAWLKHDNRSHIDVPIQQCFMFYRHERQKQRRIHKSAGSGCLISGKGANSRQQQPMCSGTKYCFHSTRTTSKDGMLGFLCSLLHLWFSKGAVQLTVWEIPAVVLDLTTEHYNIKTHLLGHFADGKKAEGQIINLDQTRAKNNGEGSVILYNTPRMWM